MRAGAPGFAAVGTHPALFCWTSFSVCWLVLSVQYLLSQLEPVWWGEDCSCQQATGCVQWNRHLGLPLQMGSAQNPDVTLVVVLQHVTFPLLFISLDV